MSNNRILISTAPYEVESTFSTKKVLNKRFLFGSELDDWICKKLAGGNIAYASRLKLVRKREIRELRDYMMSILGGNLANSELMTQVLKQAIKDLEINVRELCTITPEQITSAKTFQNNIRKR